MCTFKVTQSCSVQDFELRGFAFLHDFAVTKNYYCIFQNPVTVANTPYLLGQACAGAGRAPAKY